MRPPTSTSLYVPVDHQRATATALPAWEAGSLRLEVADAGRPVRWGASLMAVRRTGWWSRRADRGACTVDLVPAGADRTLVALTLEQPRRLAPALAAEECWSALARLREVIEAGGAAVPPPVAQAVAGPAPATGHDAELSPTRPVPSGILPA